MIVKYTYGGKTKPPFTSGKVYFIVAMEAAGAMMMGDSGQVAFVQIGDLQTQWKLTSIVDGGTQLYPPVKVAVPAGSAPDVSILS